MTEKLRPVLYVAGALLLGYLYLTWIHDPAIRRAALQVQQDTRDDSTHAANEVWKAQFLARDTARDDSLKILERGIRGARGEIARLVSKTLQLESIRDSAPRDTLLAQIALRDTIIDSLGAIDVRQTAALRVLCAPLDSIATDSLGIRCFAGSAMAERDTLIAKRGREIKALTTARDIWKRAAQKKLGCVGGIGAVVSIDGRVSAGFGLACGIRLS